MRRQQDRAAGIQRRPASRGVVQREWLDHGGVGAGAGAAALGTAGWYLGGWAGALVGGAVGAIGGYFANRWAVPRELWAEVNQPSDRYRTWSSPQTMADQMARSTPEFRRLRGRADAVVSERHGRPLRYGALPKGAGAAHSAGYVRGDVGVDTDNHPSITVPNLVFETANATHSAFFDTVRADYEDGSLGRRSLRHYASLLERPTSDLGDLAGRYESDDLPARRSLLQEWAEWRSLEVARPALEAIRPRFESRTADTSWARGFEGILLTDTFGEYYDARGASHRKQVEQRLRGARQ